MATSISISTGDLDPVEDAPIRTAPPATDKQVAFARSLYREVVDLAGRHADATAEVSGGDSHEAHVGWAETVLEDLVERTREAKANRRAMSEVIDAWIAERDRFRDALKRVTPRPSPTGAPGASDVPSGRYAVTEGGSTTFLKVDRPDEGKWAGYTFVSTVHGSPGALARHAVKDRTRREALLAAVLADGVEEAALRFGRELGACCRCGSPLTDAESRAAGIGPICATR